MVGECIIGFYYGDTSNINHTLYEVGFILQGFVA